MSTNIESSLAELGGLTESIRRIAKTIDSNRHKSLLVKGAFNAMDQGFNAHMDLIAPTQPQRYHHIYEWNQIGNPAARLWKNVLKGSGGDRVVSFDWRASTTIVPIPDLPPSKKGAQFKAIHIFVWKAPIMEYNMPVEIRPKISQVLAWLGRDGQLHFSRKPVTVTKPGGTETTGALSHEFGDWWAGEEGNKFLEESFTDPIEKEFRRKYESLIPSLFKGTIRKSKTIGLTIDPTAAAAGARVAKLVTGDLENKYIEMARRRLGG